MKSALMILSALVASSVLATEVTSTNTFGFVSVTPSGTASGDKKLVVVAVPVAGYNNVGSIAVSEILQTSNLTAGDELYTIADGGTYNKYVLNSDKTAWTASKTVTIGSDGSASETDTDSAETATIARGQAFWLKTAATTIYLMGEATSGNTGVSATGGRWNLIGSSNMVGSVLISALGGSKGDVIKLANGTQYLCTGSKWVRGSAKSYADVTDSDVIAPGVGFMYMAKQTVTHSAL